ncbi:hypothetical protein [Candidatus Leptofilum sp.]|uniref:hypothetical protein n=1 Tax=Candidatus Leptofilum sp. TaxID=3241576 RepID=UPI003B5A6E69
MRKLPESDWKKLRRIREKALDRFCTRVLLQVHAKSDANHLEEAHKSYLEIYEFIDENDEMLAILFDGRRRSTAFMTLMGWLSQGLVTKKELESLSEDTQRTMSNQAEIKFHT